MEHLSGRHWLGMWRRRKIEMNKTPCHTPEMNWLITEAAVRTDRSAIKRQSMLAVSTANTIQ